MPNKISHQKDASRARAKGNVRSETKPPTPRVSTSEFISAVAGIWDYVGDPAVFYSDESLKYHKIRQKENLICYALKLQFYTYESLKQLSAKPEGGLSTLQTVSYFTFLFLALYNYLM
ncbi:hypothetical protein BHE74_00009443 [Ensete ventricosum]|nr:hypothetical protein BHE74_00009443 [Ensete ventricosum]